MICPNCDKEMMYKQEQYWSHAFSTGLEADYPDWVSRERYTCRCCHITNVDGVWSIPKEYEPTEKQVNTILFINTRLQMNLPALTRHQCWRNIGKYFEQAKQTPLHTSEYYEELQEYFGFCEGDFC